MTSPSAPSGPTRALADFAFGSHSRIADTSRPLAWLSPEELAIDLSDPVQRRFGDYELIEQIGQGGMGVVYRARQHGLERDVAFKLLAAGPWASDEFVERFRREARSAARMQHPNIVEIYEFGHRDGLNYFSMRLVEGQSLAERLAATGPLEPREAARLLRTLAEAMDYAHRLGVLHLDLKPGNILLTPEGEPLIADFGLARRIDAGHEGGEIAGTPSYMAPEQALLESHPLSASTDIWGLGAILYECLTGRPPFVAPDAQRTLERVVSDGPAPLREANRSIPADLEAICLKCLEKEPIQRYASARELGEDLRRFAQGESVSARTPGPIERGRRWVHRNRAASGLIAVALIGIASSTWQAWRAEEARGLAQLQAQLAGEQRLIAEQQAVRMQQSMGLMAELFPTNAEQLAALENTYKSSGIAVDWLGRTLPEDRDGQFEILRAFLGALDKAGKGDAIDNFAYHISRKLGVDYYRDVAAALLQRDDREGLLGAVMVAYQLDPQTDLFESTIHRTLERAEQDPALLMAAALLCQDGGPPGTPCAVPDAADQLVAIEPENAAAWIVHPVDQSDANSASRDAIRRAANAQIYDDRFGVMMAASRNALLLSGVPLPQELAELSRLVDPDLQPEIKLGYFRFWDIPLMDLQSVVRSCDPRRSAEFDPELVEDCLKLGRKLAESDSSAVGVLIGTLVVMRLSRDQPAWDEMLTIRRQYRWMSENPAQRPTGKAMEADEAAFISDLVNHGEIEAHLRQRERQGLARYPPADWQPARPEMLLPEEDRAAYLKAREAG